FTSKVIFLLRELNSRQVLFSQVRGHLHLFIHTPDTPHHEKPRIVHSDRGSQFRSRKFQQALKRHKLRGSMGRVGAAGDNAAMESFFSLLQKNVLDRQSWRTRRELRLAIVTWVEGKYHRKRRQRGLGKLTPVEFEAIMRSAVDLAA
ncbi:transposase, partial [Brevibacterium moorei]|uniref:transposase n=1 Tax=Brevibacterium moorei TaxID=2968457 RepID=UPI00359C8C3E